jgi:hypothetical protein
VKIESSPSETPGAWPAPSPPAALSIDLKPVYESVVAAHQSAPAKHASLPDRTDYAAALIYLGRYREAIDELLAIEKKFPRVYSTATNLGTACELNGNFSEARRWIAEGMKRNPAAHEGTEWLHLAIIDARIALRDDPQWLEKNSVIPARDKHTDDEILRAIVYQLNERLRFVSPPDATVCDLFFQAGVRAPILSSREYFFTESLAFGALHRADIEQRKR